MIGENDDLDTVPLTDLFDNSWKIKTNESFHKDRIPLGLQIAQSDTLDPNCVQYADTFAVCIILISVNNSFSIMELSNTYYFVPHFHYPVQPINEDHRLAYWKNRKEQHWDFSAGPPHWY